MPRVRINAVGNIEAIGGGGRPDNSLPGGGGEGGEVDNSLPGGGYYPDNSLPPGGVAVPPIALPPLPGIWPPPGKPALPIVIPPGVALPGFPTPPIVIDPPPDKPLPVPPGEIWPPLDPIYAGKVVAVIVLGEGKVHWYVVPPPSTNPPTAQPK